MSKIDLIISSLIGFNVMAHEQKIPVYIEESNKAIAAARELKAENQELVEALEECERYGGGYTNCEESYLPPTVRDKVRAALAKHKEQA